MSNRLDERTGNHGGTTTEPGDQLSPAAEEVVAIFVVVVRSPRGTKTRTTKKQNKTNKIKKYSNRASDHPHSAC